MVEYDKYRFKIREKPKYVKKYSYCVGFRKKKKGVALTNKIGQQKSICVDCDSKKSTFLKQIIITKHAYLLCKT